MGRVPNVPPPAGFELDYLVYQLTGGKIDRIEHAERMTYAEAIRWFMLATYDAWMQKKTMEMNSKR